VVEYDPVTGQARIPGQLTEDYFHAVQSLDEGPDGALYLGLYGHHVCRYDPQTDKIEDFGPMGEGSTGYVYTIASDGNYVYSGMADHGQWYLVVYDMQAKKQETFFKPKEGEPSGGNVVRATDGSIYFNNYLLKDGQPVRPDPPVNVVAARNKGLWQLTEVETELGLELDVDDINPTVWNNGSVTVRWRPKDAAEWRSATFKGLDLQPNALYRLARTPEGKIIGFGAWYGPIFLFDPDTGQSSYVGPTPGSVYDMLAVGDKIYFCGYSSMFAVYDRTRPWTLSPKNDWYFKDQNPYRLPAGKWTTDLALGADGRIYAAGHHGRHAEGGQLTLFDPATGDCEQIREEFLKYSIRDLCPLDGGRLMALSTACLEPQGTGQVWVYDTPARKWVHQFEPLPGMVHTGNLFAAGPAAVVGLIKTDRQDEKDQDVYESLLYKLDVTSGQVIFQKTIPGRAFTGPLEFDFNSDDRRFCLGPDGCGWLFIDKTLTRIHPEDGRVEKVLDLEHGGRLLFLGEDLYIYSGGRQFFGGFSQLLRLKDVFLEE
jgi:hypothetical protein